MSTITRRPDGTLTKLDKGQWLHRQQINRERAAQGLRSLSEFDYLTLYRQAQAEMTQEMKQYRRDRDDRREVARAAAAATDPYANLRAMTNQAIGAGDLRLASGLLSMR